MVVAAWPAAAGRRHLLGRGLTIEHVVQGQSIKTDLEEPFKERLEEHAAAEHRKQGGDGQADVRLSDTGAEGE